MRNETRVVSVTSVIGNQVKNSRGEDLGQVEELIIDPDTGRIIGALLSRRAVQRGERISAIPWDAMTLNKSYGAIYVDSEIADHPLRREKDWPDTGAPPWSRNVVVYTSSIYKPSPMVK